MTLRTPLLMQAAGGDTEPEYTALEARSLLDGLFRGEGILRPDVAAAGLKVSQRAAGANFSVDIAAGRAMVAGDAVANQGLYMVESTAVENVVVPSPPGSGTRIHRVVAQLKDHLHDGTYPAGTYSWAPVLLEDTGSGTPALPGSAVALARVSVAAGQASVQNAHITDDRATAPLVTSKFAQVSSDSGRPGNPYDSETIWRTDKGCYEVAISGAWWEIPRAGGGGSAWGTYTPAWSTPNTQPVLGNGTRSGRYIQIGKLVWFRAQVTGGSTTTYGTGPMQLSLPVSAYSGSGPRQYVEMNARDSSSSQDYEGHAEIFTDASPNYAKAYVQGDNADLDFCDFDSPFTWASGDSLIIYGHYEAA